MWKQIPGFVHYEAHPSGEIRSWRRKIRRWRNPDLSGMRITPKVMKGFTDERGYRSVILQEPNGLKRMLVNRLIALTFLTNEKNLTDVAHLNGNPSDNRLENLAWMSHRDNQLMMQEHGTQGLSNKKLTLEQVQYIRSEVAKGPRGTARRMAEKFGVQPPQITRIVKRERWKVDW